MSNEPTKKKNWVYWLLFIVTIVVVFIIGMLTTSVVERRAERVAKLQPITDISEWETDNSVWGENYPREYETYLNMRDTSFRSMFGGSASIDYLELYPELVVLWAGYGFSKGYEQGRGHIYAIKDIRNIMRTGGLVDSPMPSTCWSCKSPDVPRLMNEIGVAEFYKGSWFDKGHEIINPIGCLDCHDPKTMNLRLSRPALIEALERQGRNIDEITHQEMRSLVCAQCHVEYYFKKDGNYLTFPWDEGYSVDDMEKYYDNIEFADWTHKLSRTPMLKAQHPDYELFKTGIHYARNVACADCHMPYKVSGGIKFTDHQIQSPLNAISISCQVCHREAEEQFLKDVYTQQQKVLQIRRIAERALAKAHIEAKICWDNGATEEEMAPILKLIRHAQWRWDWAAASNSMGFHSPVEMLRVLGTSIEKAEKARGKLSVVLVKHNVPIPIEFPDISTKEKAQQFVGIDIETMKQDKQDMLNRIIKDWGAPVIQ